MLKVFAGATIVAGVAVIGVSLLGASVPVPVRLAVLLVSAVAVAFCLTEIMVGRRR